MPTAFLDNLTSTQGTAATITLASLASSATAGRQSSTITFIDADYNVPQAIDIDFWCELTTGTLGSDKTVYLFMSRSIGGTSYETGPPAIGASDAAFTFTNSPVGTAPLPTDFMLVGAITFNAQSEARRKAFRVIGPPAKAAFIVLNFTGIALSSTAGNQGISYRVRNGDGR